MPCNISFMNARQSNRNLRAVSHHQGIYRHQGRKNGQQIDRYKLFFGSNLPLDREIQTRDGYKLFFGSNLPLDRKHRHIGRYKLFFGSNLTLDWKYKQIDRHKLFFGLNWLFGWRHRQEGWYKLFLWIELACGIITTSCGKVQTVLFDRTCRLTDNKA